jgi:hypothetical protein
MKYKGISFLFWNQLTSLSEFIAESIMPISRNKPVRELPP